MVSRHTVVDQRGYYFQFPTLGLPDRSGEYFRAKMVIATKDIKKPTLIFCGPTPAPLRYAPKDCPTAQVEYEGTVWILPLLPPQRSYPETEVFTVQCRRELASTMPPKATRLKVPDGLLIFAMAQSDGMAGFQTKKGQRITASTPATEADEKAFWQKTLSALFSANSSKGSLTSFGNLYKPLPSVADRTKLNKVNKVSMDGFLDWAEKPDTVLDKEWLKDLTDHSNKLAEACKTPVSPRGFGVALRALAPSDGGATLRFECAVVFDEVDMPSWHEWKEVPSHGFKPGQKLAFFKQAKEVMTKKESKEVQWKTYRMGLSPGSRGKKA